jgi:hypothetical protein
MHAFFKKNILLFCFIFISNAPALELSEFEIKIREIIGMVLNSYVTKPYEVEIKNADLAIEYNISFNFLDKKRVQGHAGIRERNLKELVAEMSISEQLKSNPEINYDKLKKYLINFTYLNK